jgi:hypothetical protein
MRQGTMTKSLIPLALAAATLTATPAFAQHRDRDRGRRDDRRVVVTRPYARVVPRAYVQRYYRPYYTFRPRVSIGFGIWAGYPVSYPTYDPYRYGYGYPAPYGYPAQAPNVYPSQPYPSQGYPAPQGYPSQGYPTQGYPSQAYPSSSQGAYPSYGDPRDNSVDVQPGRGAYGSSGGVSFDISPADASVIVDGNYVGTVDQFGPQSEPLGLTPGRHRIEIRANGLQSMRIDADVVAGQVIPYRGTLQR